MAAALEQDIANQLETVWTDVRTVLNFELFPIGEAHVTLLKLIVAFTVVVGTLFFAKFLERRVVAALTRNDPDRLSSASATARLAYYVLLIVGLTTALGTLGIRPAALFAAGAIFAVGLGFGLQNVVQNFVSGIILLGERVIKPGDILELDGEMVLVEKMGLRSTVARTLDEDQYIVPNQDLAQSKVKNYTLADRLIRLRVEVGVAYRSDLPTVFEVLNQAAAAQNKLKSKPASVLLLGFGSSSIDFEVSIWTKDPWGSKKTKSDLNLAIWRHLKDADIEIAFPQLDIHIDQPLLDAINRRNMQAKAAADSDQASPDMPQKNETEQQG